MRTLRLVFWSAIGYATILLIVRIFLPSGNASTLSIIGIPLVVIVIIIARDLSKRSTGPSLDQPSTPNYAPRENAVKFLSSQIRGAFGASDSYFDNLVRSRLRELMITKVALETGLERKAVEDALSSLKSGPKLMRDDELYTALYGPIPKTGQARLALLEKTIDMIREWKG